MAAEGNQPPEDDLQPPEDESEATIDAPEEPHLSPDDLEDALRDAYEAEDTLRRHAGTEIPNLMAALSALEPTLRDRYAFLGVLPPGGGGVPIILSDLGLAAQRAVLKLPRPVQGHETDLNHLLARETERLTETRHPNVIRILSAGTVPGADIPYYIMEYLDDAQDADRYITDHPSVDGLLSLLANVMSALAHIHSLGIVHTDVKPANVFVDRSGRAVLADFGFAKRTDPPGHTTGVGGTAGYMHPEQVALLKRARTSQRDTAEAKRQVTDASVARDDIKAYWDLYSLGVTLLVLIRALLDRKQRLGRTYVVRYLRLMAYRLLGCNLEYARHNTAGITPAPKITEDVLGLTSADITALQYASADEVYLDLGKLLGTRDLVREVPEISRYQETIIQAASHGPVSFTARVRQLVHTAEVRQLGTVAQLGLVSMVYPTATHSRLEHTLGTFASACRYIRALYADPANPLFRQLMRVEDIEALLVACLVHDVGHYPLAHDLEEVHPAIFGHEARTAAIVDNPSTALGRVLNSKASGWTVEVDRVLSILSASDSKRDVSFRDRLLGAIIDGPIDADKLDYLTRDSENLRISYGRGIDHDRLLQNLTVVMAPQKRSQSGRASFPSVGIHERGKIAAESLAFARYSLYGAVYWHRTHRTLKAMLNQVAYEALSAFRGSLPNPSVYVDKLRKRLYESLDSPDGPELPLGRLDALSTQGGSPFVDVSTERMLRWLGKLAVGRADQLVEDILGRRLYRRILVISRFRSSDFPWGTLDDIFTAKQATAKKAAEYTRVWQQRLLTSQLVQERLVAKVGEWDQNVPEGHSDVNLRLIDDLNDEIGRRPLLLLDYPVVKSESMGPLSYLCETEWTDAEGDEFGVIAADQSPIWGALAQQMQDSLAKLRIYCDPDYAGLLTAAVNRAEMVEIVEGVIEEVAEP